MKSETIATIWPGSLAKIDFEPPKPVLPSGTITYLYFAGLPRSFQITGSQLVTFQMLSTAVHLGKTWNNVMEDKDLSMPFDWARFWRIGDITYTQASAWLCIEEVTGSIYAIDVDVDDPVYLVNHSLANLVSSMLHWIQWCERTGGKVATINELVLAFTSDPTFRHGEFEAYWKLHIDSEAESGIDRFTVSYS